MAHVGDDYVFVAALPEEAIESLSVSDGLAEAAGGLFGLGGTSRQAGFQ